MTVTTVQDTRPVSAAQIKYITDLRAEGQRLADAIANATGSVRVTPIFTNPTNMSDASAYIQILKVIVAAKRVQVRNLPTPQVKAPMAPAKRTEVTEGMWIIGDLSNGGTCFKVQVAVHGSGRLYAKRLTSDGRFVVAPGAMRDISARGRKLSIEEAKAYGRLYGTCIRCGRTLTDEDSIAAGIGPICAEKF